MTGSATPPLEDSASGHATTPDGVALFWRAYLPERPRGVLLFVHGLLEHSGRYQNPARFFVPAGYACYAYDTRAHGRSPGVKMHVERFSDFLLDLDSVRALAQARHPGLPVYLVGHSHGGLVVLSYALRHPDALPGIVLSSPFLAVHAAARPSRLEQAAIRLLSRLAPRLMLPHRVPPATLSRDPTVCTAYADDPLNGKQFSARWAAEAMTAQAAVLAAAPQLRLPTLIMAGGHDRLVDAETTRRFAAAAPARQVEFVFWPESYHELFNEPDREAVFTRMQDWLAVR